MRTCLSANFPVIREFAGNFCDLQGIWPFEPIGNPLGSAVYDRNSLRKEQGIFCRELGKLAR